MQVYDETTTRAILRRASELQGHAVPSTRAGLTLTELQAAGAAAGLAPEWIAQAAHELTSVVPSSVQVGRMRVETRTVAAPMTSVAWDAIQQELRWKTGGNAEVRTDGAGARYDWAWRPGGYELLRVLIDPAEGGGTYLRVHHVVEGRATGMRFLAMFVGSLGLAAMLSGLGVGMPLVFASAVLLNVIIAAASPSLRRLLQEREAARAVPLADRLAKIVTSCAPPVASVRTAEPPALTLPDADRTAPESASSLRRDGSIHG